MQEGETCAQDLSRFKSYVLDGTTRFAGPVAPLQDQFHFSSEWTAGITDQIRLGFTVLTAAGPSLGMEVRRIPGSAALLCAEILGPAG